MVEQELPRHHLQPGVNADPDRADRDPDADHSARQPERDRDPAGRARNSRPRDALGRPLPYGSPNVERAPEGIVRAPAETIAEAQRLLDAGLPFHAHEVFEDAWKSADGADRGLWKGLAQIAVGLTHVARGGNNRGAQTLLRRGAAAIDPFRRERPHGLDVVGIITWSTELADRLGPPDSPSREMIGWSAPRLLGGAGAADGAGAGGVGPSAGARS